MSVDPLADDYPGWSPYNYVLNNPLLLVDPSGMAPEMEDCPVPCDFESIVGGFWDYSMEKTGLDQIHIPMDALVIAAFGALGVIALAVALWLDPYDASKEGVEKAVEVFAWVIRLFVFATIISYTSWMVWLKMTGQL